MEDLLDLELPPINIEESDKILLEHNSDSSDSENDNLKEYHQTLKSRLNSLHDTLEHLKVQLNEERENWRKEVNDVMQYSNNLMESVPIVTELAELDTINPDGYCDYNDYEAKVRMYQHALSQHQLESRQNLQRQIAIGNYRRKLAEVENECNLELLRVKQNVKILKPLQLIASDWSTDLIKNETLYGDNNHSKTEITTDDGDCISEVIMPMEMMSDKLREASELISSKLSATSSPNLSAQNSGIWFDDKSASQSAII